MKRILSIQDISCVGRCSNTVALPVISAAGIETSILPTAILSTHTAFEGFTFRDLTDDMLPIVRHWQQQKLGFDGIYTGFLGSIKQIDNVKKIFEMLSRPGQLHFVDPAMADDGAMYPGLDTKFAAEMRSLCAVADIIVPNLTEAAFLTGTAYKVDSFTRNEVEDLLKKLCRIGAKCAVITGVSFSPEEYGVMAYDAAKDKFSSSVGEKLPHSFPGTGDLFAASCFAALMSGLTLQKAMDTALNFTTDSMRISLRHADNCNWYGVDFEEALPEFIARLKLNIKKQ